MPQLAAVPILLSESEKASFTIEQLTQLYALACDPPEKYGRPISHWTPRELADELIEQKIVESISPRHVGRLLVEADFEWIRSALLAFPCSR